MASQADVRATIAYVFVALVTYVALQAVTIVMHEFVHSTSAWLLGYTPSPLSIVWGNPLTMRGWDEGVPYDQLFRSSGNPTEAVIGGSPLVFHTIVVTAGLIVLQRPLMLKAKWLFHTLYWFVIISLMEFISYIVMRPFASGGDTFHTNRGLELSPWLLFVAGTAMIAIALYVLFGKVLPLLCDVISPGSRLIYRAIVLMTAAILFLWGSGMRAMSTTLGTEHQAAAPGPRHERTHAAEGVHRRNSENTAKGGADPNEVSRLTQTPGAAMSGDYQYCTV